MEAQLGLQGPTPLSYRWRCRQQLHSPACHAVPHLTAKCLLRLLTSTAELGIPLTASITHLLLLLSPCSCSDSNRNRKSYVVNGSAECDWQGETYSLDQLDGTSCPETVDEMTLAAELDSCPDAEAASECAA